MKKLDPKKIAAQFRADAARSVSGYAEINATTLRTAAKMLDEHAMLEPLVKSMAERTNKAEDAQREAWNVAVVATGLYDQQRKQLEARVAELEAEVAALRGEGDKR